MRRYLNVSMYFQIFHIQLNDQRFNNVLNLVIKYFEGFL